MNATTNIRRLKTVMIMALSFLIFLQPAIYGDDTSGEAGEKTSSFKLYDNMKCGITEFTEGIASTNDIEAFAANRKDSIYLNASPIHFISPAEYTGETRKIPEHKIETFHGYASMFKKNMDNFISQYETEMLFKENGHEYWIPVQRLNQHDFGKYNIKPGDTIILNIIYLWAKGHKDRESEYGYFLVGFAEHRIPGMQVAVAEDAVFVLHEGRVYVISAIRITPEEYKNPENFSKWVENHTAIKLEPQANNKFTDVLVKDNKLAIIVNGRATLMYDYTVEYRRVKLSKRKFLRNKNI